MTRKVILTVGAPASGKSTWAKEYCKEHGAFQLERDDIRRDNYLPHGTDEKRVTDIQRAILMSVLKQQDVVISDLNLSPHNRRSLIEFIRGIDRYIEVWYKLFTDVPMVICLTRNAARNSAEQVPDSVIFSLYQTLIYTDKYHKGITPERIIE